MRCLICPRANVRLADNAIHCDGPVEGEFAAPRQSNTAGSGVPATYKYNRAKTRDGVSMHGRVRLHLCVWPPAIEVCGIGQRQPLPDTKSSGVSESVHVHDRLRGTVVEVGLPSVRQGDSPFRCVICPQANLRLVDNVVNCDGPSEGEVAAPRQSSTAGSRVPTTYKYNRANTRAGVSTPGRVCACVRVCGRLQSSFASSGKDSSS